MEKALLEAEAAMIDDTVVECIRAKLLGNISSQIYTLPGANGKKQAFKALVTQNTNYNLIIAKYWANNALPGTPFTDMLHNNYTNISPCNRKALSGIQNEYSSIAGDTNITRRWWVNCYIDIRVGHPSSNPFTFSVEWSGMVSGDLHLYNLPLNLNEFKIQNQEVLLYFSVNKI